MNSVHTRTYTVRNYELGPHRAIHVRTLMDYLQETADDHIRKLGLSVLELLKKNLLWVLAAYRLEIRRYPAAGEELTVNTWYPGPEGKFYLRDFKVVDTEGRIVAAATTSWAVIDGKKRRPVDGSEALPQIVIHPERGVEGGFEHLPELTASTGNETFTVGTGCLDMYRHVNHVFYVQWALDSVSPGVEAGCLPWSVEAVFKAEALAGDRLTVNLEPEDGKNTWLHSIVREEDGRELARLRTRWQKEAQSS